MTDQPSSTGSQQSSVLSHPWLVRYELEHHAGRLQEARRFIRELHLSDPESDLGQAAYAAMTHLLPVLADVDRAVAIARGAPTRSDSGRL